MIPKEQRKRWLSSAFALERASQRDMKPDEKQACIYASKIMKDLDELYEEMQLEYAKTYSIQELMIIKEALETQIDSEWLDFRIRMFTDMLNKIESDIKGRW